MSRRRTTDHTRFRALIGFHSLLGQPKLFSQCQICSKNAPCASFKKSQNMMGVMKRCMRMNKKCAMSETNTQAVALCQIWIGFCWGFCCLLYCYELNFEKDMKKTFFIPPKVDQFDQETS